MSGSKAQNTIGYGSLRTIRSDGGVVEQRACRTHLIKGTLLYNGQIQTGEQSYKQT